MRRAACTRLSQQHARRHRRPGTCGVGCRPIRRRRNPQQAACGRRLPGTVVNASPGGVADALRILANGGDIDYDDASGSKDKDASGDLRRGHIGIWRFTEDARIKELPAVAFEKRKALHSVSLEDHANPPRLVIHRHSLKTVDLVLKKSAFGLMTGLPILKESLQWVND